MAFFPEQAHMEGGDATPAGSVAARSIGARMADVPWFLDGREVWQVLGARRWLVAISIVALAAIALAVLVLAPAQFAATTQLLIDPTGVQVVKDDLNPPAQTSDASLLLVDSAMLVLQSDDVLRKVVDAFALDTNPEFVGHSLFSALTGAVSQLLGSSSPTPDPKLAALTTLREDLSVQRIERSFVLSLSVTTASRELSKRLAQGIAETYLGVEADSRADVARKASAALTARLGELQNAVRDAENQAEVFKTAHNLVGTRTQLVSEQQLGQIGDQLGAARARAAEQVSRLDQIRAVLRSGGSLNTLPEVLQSPTVTQLRTQLAQAERARANSAMAYGSRHPAMIAADTQVKAARDQLGAEINRIATSLRNEYAATQANVASLSHTLDTGKTEAVSVGDAMVRLRELERQIDARRSVYESFLVRARELQEQQQVASSATRIISPATLPAHRKGPPAIVVLLASLVLGLGLGLAFALAAEAITGRVGTSRRLRQRLGVPVLGALPPAPEIAAGRMAPGAFPAYELAVAHLSDRLGPPMSQARAQVVVVTAADHESGKSLLSLHLAAAAAVDHERVLLVDADPDRPLTERFGLSLAPSATKFQDGRLIAPDGRLLTFPRVRYLNAGRQTARFDPRSANAVIFGRAADLDVIVVNAGIIGADLFTDRLVSDTRIAAVLLAASAEHSTLKPIERALSVAGQGDRLACVLTDASGIDA